MGLFKPDLYRSFVVGFLIGAVALGTTLGADARREIVAEYVPATFG